MSVKLLAICYGPHENAPEGHEMYWWSIDMLTDHLNERWEHKLKFIAGPCPQCRDLADSVKVLAESPLPSEDDE